MWNPLARIAGTLQPHALVKSYTHLISGSHSPFSSTRAPIAPLSSTYLRIHAASQSSPLRNRRVSVYTAYHDRSRHIASPSCASCMEYQLSAAPVEVKCKSTEPTYSDCGRIRRPSRSCSRQCAVQPSTRETAKVGVNNSLGMPRP